MKQICSRVESGDEITFKNSTPARPNVVAKISGAHVPCPLLYVYETIAITLGNFYTLTLVRENYTYWRKPAYKSLFTTTGSRLASSVDNRVLHWCCHSVNSGNSSVELERLLIIEVMRWHSAPNSKRYSSTCVKIPTPVSLQKLVDSIGLASKFKGCNPRGKTKKILSHQCGRHLQPVGG